MSFIALAVTVPDAAWQPVPVIDQHGNVVRTERHAVWQLETDTGRVVNAGGITEGDAPVVRGRFNDDETSYVVKWVPQGGGGFLQGETGTLQGDEPDRGRIGRR